MSQITVFIPGSESMIGVEIDSTIAEGPGSTWQNIDAAVDDIFNDLAEQGLLDDWTDEDIENGKEFLRDQLLSYVDKNTGTVSLSDGDIEALLRKVFQESARVSLGLLNVYASQMEASNKRVSDLTDSAEAVITLANTLEKPTDKLQFKDDFIDRIEARQMYENAGQPIPGWLVQQDMRNESRKPTKSDLEALSRMYTNEANSEQSIGQLILNKLKTANNRNDEAQRNLASFERQRHEAVNFIVNN